METKEIKKTVADDTLRIGLHDRIAAHVNNIKSELDTEDFSLDQSTSDEEFKRRVSKYEEIISSLSSAMVIVSYWGTKNHLSTLLLPFRLLSGINERKSGKVFWIALRWYPILSLYYSCGISLVSRGKYNFLKELCDITVPNPNYSGSKEKLNQVLFSTVDNFEKPFRQFLENNRSRVPLSEYLYHNLRSRLNELVYLEYGYETWFDEFEILTALEYAHQTTEESPKHISVPIGRFGYKRRGNDNPLADLIEEANDKKEDWPPLKAGLIGGSFDRFKEISDLLVERLNKPGWGL